MFCLFFFLCAAVGRTDAGAETPRDYHRLCAHPPHAHRAYSSLHTPHHGRSSCHRVTTHAHNGEPAGWANPPLPPLDDFLEAVDDELPLRADLLVHQKVLHVGALVPCRRVVLVGCGFMYVRRLIGDRFATEDETWLGAGWVGLIDRLFGQEPVRQGKPTRPHGCEPNQEKKAGRTYRRAG